MDLRIAKAIVAGTWLLIMGMAVYLANTTSLTRWGAMLGLTIIPIGIMWRWWNVPSQTLSESINESRRR
ncbi:MAG TPA: hypothetical protein VH740_19055 [Vicinamibacterales bacterium]|jgi:hypothetical protein